LFWRGYCPRALLLDARFSFIIARTPSLAGARWADE
jgi:hypothetical protein